jgi:hypothetical protein
MDHYKSKFGKKNHKADLYLMPPDMASVAFMALVDLGKGNELIL